jgi:hypothetical protein
MDQPQQPANEDQVLRPLAADFDRDPERFAANQLVTQKFAILGDVHDQVADRLAEITSGPILDLGGGNGSLGQAAKLADSCCALQVPALEPRYAPANRLRRRPAGRDQR